MVSEAVSTCKLRRYNAEAKVFLVLLQFNDVPFQKTLVEKGLATRATAPAAAPAPAPAPQPPPPNLAPVVNTITDEATRSVSVIRKNSPSEPVAAAASAAPTAPVDPVAAAPLMVPRSVRTPPPPPSSVPSQHPPSSRPEKTIAIASMQIGSESEKILMFVSGFSDFAVLMCGDTEIGAYSEMEGCILALTNELMEKRGKFADPERQLQRGGAVLALFEGQVKERGLSTYSSF